MTDTWHTELTQDGDRWSFTLTQNGIWHTAMGNYCTPIKPSDDTGELRERMAEIAWRFRGNERLGGPWYPNAKPTDSPAMRDCFAFADAILDLIQSERAGSPIGQNDQPDLA